MTEDVLFHREGPIGVVTLNRPKALNALTLPMVRAIDPQLAAWADDDGIEAVVIRGAGDRAFCAGGDVRAVAEDGLAARRGESDGALTRDFFREEYILNRRIFRFPKPYIAFIDGISMGGGKGLSAHGSHRVVTERVTFAMPETQIGLFPDVGGSHFLPRLPGQLGIYLALSGARSKAADCLHVGYGTSFVPSERLPAVLEDLAAADFSDRVAAVDAVLEKHAGDPGAPALPELREAVDRCFAFDRVEDIFSALEAESGPHAAWAAETLATLRRMSPISLKITLRQLRAGATLDFEDGMTMEYRIVQRCMEGHDFFEGIRAQLIDKDRSPKWDPDTVEAIADAEVDRYFAPLGVRDLVFDRA
jgi:enoyl-CoA hydratase